MPILVFQAAPEVYSDVSVAVVKFGMKLGVGTIQSSDEVEIACSPSC